MLKQHREKQQLISSQNMNKVASKDVDEIFKPPRHPELENQFNFETEQIEVPTLFKSNKISEHYQNPTMIVRQSARVLTSPKTQ